jgi:hypothetical protein
LIGDPLRVVDRHANFLKRDDVGLQPIEFAHYQRPALIPDRQIVQEIQ